MRGDWGLFTTAERERLLEGSEPVENSGQEKPLHDRIEAIERDAELLAEYDPGLARELQQAVERAVQRKAGPSEDGETVPPTLGELDFPHEDEKCKSAAYAARSYVRATGGATREEIIKQVMPMSPLTYQVDVALGTLEADEAGAVPWWREVVKPALYALPSVEPPETDEGEWVYCKAGGKSPNRGSQR